MLGNEVFLYGMKVANESVARTRYDDKARSIGIKFVFSW